MAAKTRRIGIEFQADINGARALAEKINEFLEANQSGKFELYTDNFKPVGWDTSNIDVVLKERSNR